MPTLNIGGQKVKVGDEFLSLSPEQQNATVEEIAGSLSAPRPSTVERAAVPQGVTRITVGGVQNGNASASQPVDNFAQMLTDFQNQGAAAGQRTTPNIASQSKNLISDNVQEGDDGNAYFVNPAGKLQITDRNKHVMLRDPADGKLKIYGRTDSTDEGVLSSAGRLLGTGLATGAPVTRAVGPVAEAVQGPGRQVVEASQRLGIDVPRAISSDSAAVQRIGQGIRNIPVVGDAIPRATQQLTDDLGGAVQRVAGEFGQGSGPNVAHRVGNVIGGAADAETQAATAAARRTDEAALSAWEAAHGKVNQLLDATDTQALQSARQAVGDLSPQDMGQALITRLRAGEQAAKARKEELYGIAGKSEASIQAGAAQKIPSDIANSLESAGIVVDPVLTPAASRMITDLNNIVKRSPVVGGVADPAESAAQAVARPIVASANAPKTADVATTAGRPSLLEFLASKGGLGPDAELNAIGAHGHVVNVNGLGRRSLIKQGGSTLDYAREAAEEAGYLRGAHNQTSTVADLLDAIDAEIRGQKLYPAGAEGSLSKREIAAGSERSAHEYLSHTQGLEDDLAAAGHSGLAPDIKRQVIRLMSDENLGADAAVAKVLRSHEQGDSAVYGASFRGAPVNIQVLEHARKRLNALSRAATNDADRRAASGVVREFDKWLDDAFDNALFSGSDEALSAIKSARKANTEWRSKFFNTADDAGKIINKIATGEVTPQEVANWVVGASKVGAKGVSSRFLTQLARVTGSDPEAMQAIRGGIWNRLSQSTTGVDAKVGPKVANEINEFLGGSGRDIANRLFTPEQRGIMKAYADTVRSTSAQREALPAIAKASKPAPTEVGIGPMQQLADTVLGRNGRTDEAIFAAINAYAKSGGRGDVQTLARVIHALPLEDRGNLAGSIIRQIGVSPRTGQFSPDVFASQWQSYTPQAKALLFGNAGAHRQALDDIMTVSERMKQIGSRFGNPSGTAQNAGGIALGSSAVGAVAQLFSGNPVPALTLLSSVLGGGTVAKVLASPAGAASAAKWTRAYSALRVAPSAQRLVTFEMASRNLANTAGGNVSAADFLKAVQGTVPSRAQDEQQ